MKYFLIFFLSAISIACSNVGDEFSNQDKHSLTIPLDTIYDEGSKGILILQAIDEMEDSLRSKIKFPDLSQHQDTAYTKIYFTGKNKAGLENGILVLIGDYSSKSPFLYVDHKNDLIFNDNKEALSFSDEFIDISILDIENPNLFSVFRLSRPDSTIREQAQDAILQYITKGKEFADFYFNQRRNIRVSDVVYKEDSIRIGIMDFNVNGKYNDLGSDRIVIGNYAGKISGTEKASGAVILDSSTYFQSANYAFEVVQVAENGTSISFKPTFSTNADKRIEVGDSIKNYPFELLSGKKTSMHDFLDGNRYLYLHFWATWCAGCHQEMEDLHRLDSTNRNVVRIVSLNYNENITKIKSFTDQYKISWINGLSTTEINEALSVVGLPRNILINPSGKIIDMDSHPSDLLKQIDEF